MARKRTYEEQALDLERQIGILRERKRQVLAKHGEEKRRALAQARTTLGTLLLESFPDGNWRAVDWDRLEDVLTRNRDVFAGCVAEELPVAEATRRMREWERGRLARTVGEPGGGDAV